MGDKARARDAARRAGVPILQGSEGAVGHGEDLIAEGREIGYPLVVKASAGGGGRGIRLVAIRAGPGRDRRGGARRRPGRRSAAPMSTLSASWAGPGMWRCRFSGTATRHPPGDRDCSMQRRQQKILEEAPAPALPDAVRERIRESSVELARECHYRGLGTVEFLYDPESMRRLH